MIARLGASTSAPACPVNPIAAPVITPVANAETFGRVFDDDLVLTGC